MKTNLSLERRKRVPSLLGDVECSRIVVRRVCSNKQEEERSAFSPRELRRRRDETNLVDFRPSTCDQRTIRITRVSSSFRSGNLERVERTSFGSFKKSKQSSPAFLVSLSSCLLSSALVRNDVALLDPPPLDEEPVAPVGRIGGRAAAWVKGGRKKVRLRRRRKDERAQCQRRERETDRFLRFGSSLLDRLSRRIRLVVVNGLVVLGGGRG